ncbi:MAG TPA: HdeD family acid-resistance protein [Noviherbaspirillum sp.]|uniref:HdeD family acid-resistance protein n=1 Tax=Noviherbaspirillum sp. TaxID=1926288 RepID=UPI002B47E26E|nr:HdeD family acid-resistance protein [Noviherbaspirillum sp.]HJV85386.1 HdeD family acid-resistance protein [Noviherbaspirillum sp.]
MMSDIALRSWWVYALRGLVAIVFGLLALTLPAVTLLSLVALFAAYAFIAGVVSVAGAVRNRRHDEDWWLPLLFGLVSIGAAVIAVIHPALTALVFVLVIGANALVGGVLDIAAAIRLRKVIRGEWMLVLSGIASIVFGALVFLFPGAGALALIWWISLYAVVTGVLLLALAFRLRTLARSGRIERRVIRDRRASTPQAAH